MMSRSTLAGVLASLLVLGGCYMPPSSVQAPPPQPAAPPETAAPQPGPSYVWVPGHWETQAGGNTWVDGYWRQN